MVVPQLKQMENLGFAFVIYTTKPLSRVVGGRCHTTATPLVNHGEPRPQDDRVRG